MLPSRRALLTRPCRTPPRRRSVREALLQVRSKAQPLVRGMLDSWGRGRADAVAPARVQVVHEQVLTATAKACAPELHTRASWGGSARARGPVREGGDLGHARGARGRPVARLACRSARSALFEPVSRSSSSETSTLRRSAQSAWPTRTRPRRELRSEVLHHRRTVSVAPASAGGQRKVGGATERPRRLAYSTGDVGQCSGPHGVAGEAPWVARSA